MVKAQELSLKNLLDLSPEGGKIQLKDRRMVISSADAWGLLRKDLISALGMERAKRFLLRYGWNCGVNDARNLRSMFDWEQDVEWMLAGPQMHTMTGNVLSQAVKVEIDREKGTFFFDGYWINSFEAEQHLLHFSQHDEPVCYILLGYAGGYSSEYMGKKIIFKEIECVGRGDQRCRNVGKTIEEWGDEIIADLADYEEKNLADELDLAYLRIEKQKEILKLGFNVNQKLTDIILQGKGLDALAKALGETLGCAVLIENASFERIASYGTIPDGYIMPVTQVTDTKSELDGLLHKLLVGRRTTEFDLKGAKRLMTPVILQNQIYGFVSLIKSDGCFGEMERVSLERTAAVSAIQLLNERTAIETEQRIKGELLDELLNPDVDVTAISKRLSYLGYHFTEPQYVFVFRLESKSHSLTKEEEDHQLTVRNKIVELFFDQFSKWGYRSLISAKLDRIYTIVTQSFITKQRQNLRQYGEYLLRQIQEDFPNAKVTLGISNICHELKAFHKGYQEAVKAIEIAHIKNKDQKVVLSSELGHIGLLLNARYPEELETFAKEKIGVLYDYDQNNNTELVKTLYYYAKNEYNLHKSAREMNISISGLRYRIQRIQELTHLELSGSAARFEVQLALDIFLVLGILILD